LTFTDLDLDATELGGFIYWAEPTDTAQARSDFWGGAGGDVSWEDGIL
jgi:hypothetical protein